ncbi:MAG TPA: glycosyl hydrolase, partial [Gaiellaceae bacterium]|nr:glycosyl hydrolase [Gaiellaceae bacterium]
HVVTIFRDAGATNVTWIWSPNVVGYTVRDPLAYYPGNDWVDWVGMDGYNDGRPWITFTQTFSATYARLVGLGKPMLVAETASTEGASTAAKADWIRAIAPAVQSMPAIKAVIWFDLNRPRGVWRLDNSAPAAAAFADLLTKQPNPSCPPRQWTTSCYEARSAVTTDGNINAPSR